MCCLNPHCSCNSAHLQVDHELAVPAVSGILLSMAAWGVAQVHPAAFKECSIASSSLQHHAMGDTDATFPYQVTGLMVLERLAEARAQPRLALAVACAAVTLALQIVVGHNKLFTWSYRAFGNGRTGQQSAHGPY